MVIELSHAEDSARRARTNVVSGLRPDDSATRLIWNGVSGCRQVEVNRAAKDRHGVIEKREERVIGEVAEPLS